MVQEGKVRAGRRDIHTLVIHILVVQVSTSNGSNGSKRRRELRTQRNKAKKERDQTQAELKASYASS